MLPPADIAASMNAISLWNKRLNLFVVASIKRIDILRLLICTLLCDYIPSSTFTEGPLPNLQPRSSQCERQSDQGASDQKENDQQISGEL